HMGDGRIESNAQKLGQLGGENVADVNRGGRGDEGFRPRRVQLEERVPGGVPLTGGFHLVADWCGARLLRRGLYAGSLRFFEEGGASVTFQRTEGAGGGA